MVLAVQHEGLVVSDVVVLIDREQGGAARMAANSLTLPSAFTLSFILQARAGQPPPQQRPLLSSFQRLHACQNGRDWVEACSRLPESDLHASCRLAFGGIRVV